MPTGNNKGNNKGNNNRGNRLTQGNISNIHELTELSKDVQNRLFRNEKPSFESARNELQKKINTTLQPQQPQSQMDIVDYKST